MFFVSIHASFRLMISKANLRLADISEWVVLVMMAENCVLLPPVSHTKSFILFFLHRCASALLWTMAPFLRISFNSFELGPVQNQGELQPFCAIKMKEALTTGEVTNGDAFPSMKKLLRNTAIPLRLWVVTSATVPVTPRLQYGLFFQNARNNDCCFYPHHKTKLLN